MKNKRLLSLALAVGIPALAAAQDTGFSDVAADAWYAEAVAYVREKEIMNGTSAATFAPDATTTRGQMAAILYRAAGSPNAGADNSVAFSDVPETAYYAQAVRWANANGLITGYSDGTFRADNPVTREQMTTILWRYAGSPTAGTAAISDSASVSSYAASAVSWAVGNNIVAPVSGDAFQPQSPATRAQIAAAFMNYDRMAQPDAGAGGKVLVVYYSASNNTKTVAGYIASELNADQFEIVPAKPYTSEDLDWTNPDSRVNAEHEDASLRNVELESAAVENWDEYDTVFIGYPIWWAIAAWPTDSFVKANDFTGKTVIPFCTSTSSGLGESGTLLAELAGTGNWLEGQRFRSGAPQTEVQEWVRSLNLSN